MTLILVGLTVSCRKADPLPSSPAPAPEVLSPGSHRDLQDYFMRHGYSWETIQEQGVPPFIVEKLPQDFNLLEAGPQRKRTFFLSLLPMVLMLNDEIMQERQELLQLFERYDRGDKLSRLDLDRISHIVTGYKVDRDPLTDIKVRERLLSRIDILPPSLVLAQAASESAYGTSRFAKLGNNLFGERTFGGYAGLIPHARAEGETFKVRTFPTLLDSLRSYVKNLNTNPVYQGLRDRRAKLRAQGFTLRGGDLAEGLGGYAENSADYISSIRTIISNNRLSLLGKAALRPPPPMEVVQPPSRPHPPIGVLVTPKAE